MKICDLRMIGRKKLLENNIDDSIIKADILLQFVLKLNKQEILLEHEKKVTDEQEKQYLTYIIEVIDGKPVQYITNEQEFMNLKFYVDENVLIPQPDTEILVEETIKQIKNINLENVKILDLCTGSGAIAISIKKYTEGLGKNIEMYASDISQNAIKVAAKNAKKNNTNIKFILSNMFENINIKEFNIIVSNPPYIETKTIKKLSKEVQNEPHIALDGGSDGLTFYKIIANEANKYLNKNGYIFLEIGYNQKKEVIKIFEKNNNYTQIKCIKDLSSNDRVIKIN